MIIIKLKKNLFLVYLVFIAFIFGCGFLFDDSNNSLLNSVDFPETLSFDSLADSYILEGTINERTNLFFDSLTELSTWILIIGAFFGVYAVFWFFDNNNLWDLFKIGFCTIVFMFSVYLFGINIFELNIFFKTSSYTVALINFLLAGKIFGLIYLKFNN